MSDIIETLEKDEFELSNPFHTLKATVLRDTDHYPTSLSIEIDGEAIIILTKRQAYHLFTWLSMQVVHKLTGD